MARGISIQTFWRPFHTYKLQRAENMKCSQDFASSLKLNFCFSERMGHVLVRKKLYE